MRRSSAHKQDGQRQPDVERELKRQVAQAEKAEQENKDEKEKVDPIHVDEVEAEQALEEEGFSSKRAASLSKRVARAKKALEFITDQAFDELACREAANRIRIDSEKFRVWPDEIGLRVILKIIHQFRQHDEYGVRLEKAEALFEEIKRHIQKGEAMKRRSLGNCLFAFDPKKRALLIEQEHEID